MGSLICVGTSAILWSIWLSRNDVTFDKKKIILLFHVIFRATYLTRLWNILQKENRSTLKWACRILETLATEVFAKHGWSSFKRINA